MQEFPYEKTNNEIYKISVETNRSTLRAIVSSIRSAIRKIFQGGKNLIHKGLDILEDPLYDVRPEIEGPPQQPQSVSEPSGQSVEFSPNAETPKTETPKEEITIEVNPEIEKKLDIFNKEFKPNLKNILAINTGNNDISSSFTGAKITYIDNEDEPIEAHRRKGEQAKKMQLKDYGPEQDLDLVLIHHPIMDEDDAQSLVLMLRNCKFIVTAGYPDMIERLKEDPELKLAAVITSDNKVVRNNLDSYTQEVENDAELEKLYPLVYKGLKEEKDLERKSPAMSVLEFMKEKRQKERRKIGVGIPFKKGGPLDYYVFRKKHVRHDIQKALPSRIGGLTDKQIVDVD